MFCFVRSAKSIVALSLLCVFSVSSFAATSTKTDDAKDKAKQTKKQTKKDSSDAKTEAVAVQKPVSHWAGSNAQLGLIMNTGNTNSTNISGGAKLKYTNSPWLNVAEVNAQLNRSLGTTTKERYYASDQLQYSFSKQRKNFVYGNVNFTDDRSSPYVYQVVGSVGYGRDLIKTDKFVWSAQAGPGMRYDNVRGTDHNNKSFIAYTATNADWKMTKNIDLSETLQYTMGHPYNYLNAITALTNKLTGNLAMQISYTIQHYSAIPLGSTNTKKTDTITNIALVYNF